VETLEGIMSIDTILGIVGTVLGIIGLITGYVFYRKGLRVKEPYYSIISNNLMQDGLAKLDGLQISYKGQIISNLTVSRLIVWNDGVETIDKNDVVKSDPLRLECVSNNHILDANVIFQNNQSNQILITIGKQGAEAKISFDYLDKNDGAIFQIFHTGKSSDDLVIKGKIKGTNIRFYLSRNTQVTKTVSFLLAIFFIAFFVIVFIQSFMNLAFGWILTMGLMLLVLFLLYISGYTKKLDKMLPNKLPKEFNDRVKSF
jgi:hypothetical protein